MGHRRGASKGIFSLGTKYYNYIDIKKQYNPDGKAEDLPQTTTMTWTAMCFRPCAPESFCRRRCDRGPFSRRLYFVVRKFEFSLYYGLTDKISVGVLAPYSFLKNKVDASLDASTANVGKNPFLTPYPLICSRHPAHGYKRHTGPSWPGLDINGDGKIDIRVGYNGSRHVEQRV